MTQGQVVELIQQAVLQVLNVASPLLITALAVGLTIAILQAASSIQEQTLVFVPKIISILLVLSLLGGFMISSMEQFTLNLFSRIPDMAR